MAAHVELDGANRHDVKLVDSTLAGLSPVAEAVRDVHRAAGGEQGLCRGAGYDAKQVRETLTALGDTAYIQSPRRGSSSQKSRLESLTLGRGTHPLLAQPLSILAHSVGQKLRKLLGHAPFCLRPNYLVQLSVWIAFKLTG